MTSAKPSPNNYHTVTPYILVQDADKLIDFVKKAFDAKETERITMPDGSIGHAEVRLGDSVIMVADAKGEQYKPMPTGIYLYVDDCDATYKRALQAGAISIMESKDQFYGDRSCGIKDQFGNQWWIATRKEDLSPEEYAKRKEEFMKQQQEQQAQIRINMEKGFPDWNKLYNTQNVETMPWYNENLDSDLEEELESRKISKGRILDLGTGPATQAKQLAKRGLKVTGSDVSETAINKARELYVNNNSNNDIEINFIVDDILNSKIKDKMFDYVFDRGCFHVLPIDKRPVYIKEIKRMLDDRGILFLKCFSIKEPRQEGPYKFSGDGIRKLFRNDFIIMSVKDTVYQGTLDPLPRALFVVMSKQL